jgi:hypothetical protein
MNTCPQRAIETGHGYFFSLYFLIHSVGMAALWMYLSKLKLFPEEGRIFWILQQIIDTALTLFLFFLGYRLIHYLKRMVILKQIIEYTSLTKYAFWRRYKYKETQKENDMTSSV